MKKNIQINILKSEIHPIIEEEKINNVNFSPNEENTAKKNNYPRKSTSQYIRNGNNKIKPINDINTNLNNIINIKYTPNKCHSQTKENVYPRTNKNERNYHLENNQIQKNFLSLGQNNQNNNLVSLHITSNSNSNPDQNIITDAELKYKLILQEKNNIIGKLKNEIEYYKNYVHNNILLSNNNNISSANRAVGPIEFSNNNENIRTRIKNVFAIPKKDINSNHRIQLNIKNNSNNMDTIDSNYISSNNKTRTINATSKNDKQLKIVMSQNSINNQLNNNNKLVISNDNYQNGLNALYKNYNSNTKNEENNNLFNNDYKNQQKVKKLKLGSNVNELTLDVNNFNSIEANSKKSVKTPKHIIFSLNVNDIHEKNDKYNTINNEEYEKRNPNHKANKVSKYYSNNASSVNSKERGGAIKYLSEINNSGSSLTKNDASLFEYNYKEYFEDLKHRMRVLVENLFALIEYQNENNDFSG